MRPPHQSFQHQGPKANVKPRQGVSVKASARDVVHRALAHQAERYPDLDLAPLDTQGLEGRDAALAHAIYDGVLRRWITLGYLIEGFCSRGFGELDPRIRGVLLAGAAQLLLLDRVPPHAVLNESVDWTKKHVKPEAARLVNAVLRRLAELVHADERGLPEAAARVAWTSGRNQLPLADGTAVVLRQEVFPAAALKRTALATSHPTALVERWAAVWGETDAVALAGHGLCNPPTVLQVRFARGPMEDTLPHEEAGHAVYTGSRAGLLRLMEARGDVWVQDAASGLAVAGAAELRPGLVLDLCAGQGTKTRQLAMSFPGAKIMATDVDERRLETLRGVARQYPNVEVVAAPEIARFAGKADLILLDVPCSNSGVLARRPEAKYRCDATQLARLVALQQDILRQAVGLMAAGGVIVYSTCSIEREENELQAAWAQQSLGLAASNMRRTMPRGQPGEAATGYHDGAFSVHLHRG